MRGRAGHAMFFAGFCIALISWSVHGDITGKFVIDVGIVPQTTAAEFSLMDFDVEPNLQVNFSTSGLITGLDLGVGIAGLEFAIASLTGSLGVLDVFAQVVFARPFGLNSLSSTPEVIPPGQLLFVTKRVQFTLEIGGVNISNLAMFQDVTFSNPFSFASGSYGPQSQTFRFGDIVTISGSTPSGIRVSQTFSICADPNGSSAVKKRFFSGMVMCEDLSLKSGKAVININNVPIAPGLTMDSETILSVSPTFKSNMNLRLVFDGGPAMSGSISFEDLQILETKGLSFSARLDPLTVIANFDTAFVFQAMSITLFAGLSDAALLLASIVVEPGKGISSASVTFAVRQDSLRISASASYGDSTSSLDGQVQSMTFLMEVPIGPVAMALNARFSLDGLNEAKFRIELPF